MPHRRYQQLTAEERSEIYALRKSGLSSRAIAAELGRAASTICREVRRNTGLRGYRPVQAHQAAVDRGRCSRHRKPKIRGQLRRRIISCLREGWSPEQISGRMAASGTASISHESIHRFLQQNRRSGGTLHRHLRHGHRKRRKRYGAPDRRGRIRDQVMIDARPAIIDHRGRVGDWEIDTVHGRGSSGSLVTIVERLTGVAVIGKVGDRCAETVTDCSIDLLEPIRTHVHSITADNGKEFADHRRLDAALDARIYFAHPYHSWERGTNENTNGLVRQYLPKGTDFRRVDQHRCERLADRLDDRPRKRLGYRTPREAFETMTGGRLPRATAQGRPTGRPWAVRLPIIPQRVGVALRN